MGVRHIVLDMLRQTEASAADHALVTALGRTDLSIGRLIVQTLLSRNKRDAMKGLIACWHRLEDPLREQILAKEDEVFAVLRESMASAHENVRANVIAVIRMGAFYRASYLLESALHDRSTAVRDAAAAAVGFMAEQLLIVPVAADSDVRGIEDPAKIREYMVQLENWREDRRQLASAIETGLGGFDIHHQTGVVEAAMWFVDDLGMRFWKSLSAPGSKALRAAQSILAKGEDTRLIPFMIQALNYAEFRPLISQTLAHCANPEFLTEWFRQSWRLLQSKTAKGLTALRDLAATRNQLLDILTMPDDAQRHFSRCVPGMGLPEPMKIEVLKEMHRRGQPAGRRAAMWSLTRSHDETRSLAVLRSIASQETGEDAWIARCELTRRHVGEFSPRELVLSRRAPAQAEKTPSPSGQTVQAYWGAFDRLPEPERISWGRRLVAEQRLTRTLVNGWLSSPEPSDRVRALRIINVLSIAKEFETRLYELCHDASPDVRSAVVIVLGQLPTPGSRRILHSTLYDSDARVQANSVEALDRLGASESTVELIAKLAASDNRTRANAVLVLLKLGVREAAETLLLMLKDTNRAHRTSGLWLAEQMCLLPLAERILQMAGSDDDEQVRNRARTLAGRLYTMQEPGRVQPKPAGVPA